MKTQNSAQKRAILVLALVVGFVFFYAVSQYNTKGNQSVFSEFSPINYIMGKIKAQDAGFSLEGREIENQFLAQAKKVKKSKTDNKNKNANDKKSLDSQKKTAALNAQAKAHKVAQQQARRQGSSQQVKRNAIKSPPPLLKTTADTEKTSANKNETIAQNTKTENTIGSAFIDKTDATAFLDDNKNQDVAKKTLEQWKGELYAEQSKEFIVKLAAALKSGDITEENYHLLANELLESNDEKFIALGLYALRSAPSIKSFTQLIQIEDSIEDKALKVYIQESLLSYNQASLRGILQNAIIQKDKTVVLKALEVTNQGLNSIQSGDYTLFSGIRNIRNTSSQPVTVNDYKSFLPFLNQALTSGDTEIVAMATKVLNLINQSKMIASN